MGYLQPLWVSGDSGEASGQGEARSLPEVGPTEGREVPYLARLRASSAAGSGWPTAVSTRAWSSPAAASCTPSPASSTSGSKAGSRQNRWAGAGARVSGRQGLGSRSAVGPHDAAPVSQRLPGPAAGGAGHLVQLPAGLRPLPPPEVPDRLPLLGLRLPSPAAVSPQVSGLRDQGKPGQHLQGWGGGWRSEWAYGTAVCPSGSWYRCAR